jgi:MFS family permease
MMDTNNRPLGTVSRGGVEQTPAAVRALGWTSFLTDLSSEAIYPLLPGFVKGLGGTSVEIGLIDGIANAVAAVVRLPSGAISDAVGRRPLAAMLFLLVFPGQERRLFLRALLPGLATLAVIWRFVHDPPRRTPVAAATAITTGLNRSPPTAGTAVRLAGMPSCRDSWPCRRDCSPAGCGIAVRRGQPRRSPLPPASRWPPVACSQ